LVNRCFFIFAKNLLRILVQNNFNPPLKYAPVSFFSIFNF
jgi:hypothetical protein